MPIYEYKCGKCGVFEVTQRITEKPLKKCPTCKGKIERIISATSFVLKGTGWYATDYAKPGAAKTDSQGESKTDSKADSKTESAGESAKSASSTTSESSSNGAATSAKSATASAKPPTDKSASKSSD